MELWKDFNSTLFANIVSSLGPAQILGRAKVFWWKFESSKSLLQKIWVELKSGKIVL